MKRNKESVVVYEDWLSLTEMMNESDCRQFYRNLFKHVRGEEPILNTPALQAAWNIMYNEHDKNVKSRKSRQDNMNIVRQRNPKHANELANKPASGPANGTIDGCTNGGMDDGKWKMGNNRGMVDTQLDKWVRKSDILK
jgi:hypothetical protein